MKKAGEPTNDGRITGAKECARVGGRHRCASEPPARSAAVSRWWELPACPLILGAHGTAAITAPARLRGRQRRRFPYVGRQDMAIRRTVHGRANVCHVATACG